MFRTMSLISVLSVVLFGFGCKTTEQSKTATATVPSADAVYDFRRSEAFVRLSPIDKEKLEQVKREQVLLLGALDMYADGHQGNPPENLDALVPKYLKDLPSDPFATESSAGEKDWHDYTPSKKGWGYRYRRGAAGNRAWAIASVGLPQFPYLAEKGNVGLYVCKGTWIGGVNPGQFKEGTTEPVAPVNVDKLRR